MQRFLLKHKMTNNSAMKKDFFDTLNGSPSKLVPWKQN